MVKSNYAICRGGQRRWEQQTCDEKTANRTLLIKENIEGNAIDQKQMIGKNIISVWNFTEFLNFCYWHTRSSFSNKTWIPEKKTYQVIPVGSTPLNSDKYIITFCNSHTHSTLKLLQILKTPSWPLLSPSSWSFFFAFFFFFSSNL